LGQKLQIKTTKLFFGFMDFRPGHADENMDSDVSQVQYPRWTMRAGENQNVYTVAVYLRNSMTKRCFCLVASVNTDSPEAIQPVLERLVGKGSVAKIGNNEFRIETQIEGEDAKELNRSLLSELRRIERKTRLRAEWTSDETTERFFDYVQKKRRKTPLRGSS
jgi:hypothetical protein